MADGSTFDLDADIVELAPCAAPATVPLREISYRAAAWAPEECDRLQSLFTADVDVREIAETIGRPFHAVRTKICELGLRRNSKRSWAEWEDAEIVRRYGDDATSAIAQDLGRSCGAVYQRANRLGLTEGRPAPYTPWEDEQIKAGYAAGVPVAQIAALIGRPLSGLLNHAFDHLKIRHINAPAAWSQAEVARAVELAGDGMTNRQIAAQLAAEGFPERTRQATKLMMTRLVEGRGWGRIWTDDEDEWLRRAYAAGESLTPLRTRLGRTRSAIRYRVGYLGLQGTHRNAAGWRTEPVWTPEEDALLREHYGKTRGKALFALFEPYGRKKGGVYMRARALGLDGGYSREVTEDDLRAIQIAFRVGIGLTDLALAMDRDTAIVHRLAKAMGLHFSDRSRPKVSKRPRASRPPPPSLAEILSMECDLPGTPFLPLLAGWRKRGRPTKMETGDVA